jgi:hypothetical protein
MNPREVPVIAENEIIGKLLTHKNRTGSAILELTLKLKYANRAGSSGRVSSK